MWRVLATHPFPGALAPQAPSPPASPRASPRGGVGAPSLGAPAHARRQGEGGRRPRSPEFPRSLPLGFRKWGKVVMETFPLRGYGSWGASGDSGAGRSAPTPTCGDQCRGGEEQQQKPESEPGRRRRRRRTLGSARQHSTRHVGHLPQTGGGGFLGSPSGPLMRC